MRRFLSLAVPALVCLFALAADGPSVVPLAAQAPGVPFGPDFFASLKWRNIGPNRGGRSIAVARKRRAAVRVLLRRDRRRYVEDDRWRNHVEAGRRRASSGPRLLARSPCRSRNPDVVYAGMGETELRGNIIQGDGVYKTTDAGKTWTHVGLADTQAIARIRSRPVEP